MSRTIAAGETVLVNESQHICTDFSKKANELKVAEAFGLHCQRLDDHNDIEAALSEALYPNGPSFIEMAVVSQNVIVPFVPKRVRSARKKNTPNIY